MNPENESSQVEAVAGNKASPPDDDDGKQEKTQNEKAGDAEDEKKEEEVTYSVSGSLMARLASLNISLAFTSYQSGLLYFIGHNKKGRINVHQTGMARPMGLCLDARGSLIVTGDFQIIRFINR